MFRIERVSFIAGFYGSILLLKTSIKISLSSLHYEQFPIQFGSQLSSPELPSIGLFFCQATSIFLLYYARTRVLGLDGDAQVNNVIPRFCEI